MHFLFRFSVIHSFSLDIKDTKPTGEDNDDLTSSDGPWKKAKERKSKANSFQSTDCNLKLYSFVGPKIKIVREEERKRGTVSDGEKHPQTPKIDQEILESIKNIDATKFKDAPSEDDIIVNFEVVLSPDFRFDAMRDKLFIFAGYPISDFKSPCVVMEPFQELQDGFIHFKGFIVIFREFVDAAIPYKYVVYKEGSDRYEWEDLNGKDFEIWNRCLTVPKNHPSFLKIDDIIQKRYHEQFHAKNRVFSMIAMQPDFDDVMKSEDEDGIYGLALKSFNVRCSLWKEEHKQFLIHNGKRQEYCPGRLNFDSWIGFFRSNFIDKLTNKELSLSQRLKCALFIVFARNVGTILLRDKLLLKLFWVFEEVCNSEEKVKVLEKFHFSENGRSKLAECILNIAEEFLMIQSNMDTSIWMYAMPLIHFLDSKINWMPTKHFLRTLPDEKMLELLSIDEQFGRIFLEFADEEFITRLIIKQDYVVLKIDCIELLKKILLCKRLDKELKANAVIGLKQLAKMNKEKYEPNEWTQLMKTVILKWSQARFDITGYLPFTTVLFQIMGDLPETVDDFLKNTFAEFLIRLIDGLRLENDGLIMFLGTLLKTFQNLDEIIYGRFLEELKRVVDRSEPGSCLMAFIDHADKYPKEAAEILIQKPREMLRNTNRNEGYLMRGWNQLKNMVLGESQAQNLARVIRECLDQNVNEEEDVEMSVRSYTRGETLHNMLAFYPQVKKQFDADNKMRIILKNLERFKHILKNGDITFETLTLFHEEKERLDRFEGLVIGDEGKELPKAITKLLKIRIEEALEIKRVEEKIHKFSKLMQKYARNITTEKPSFRDKYLSDFCIPRDDLKDNVKRISEITDENVTTIDKVLKLRDHSKTFLKILTAALEAMSENLTLEQVVQFVNRVLIDFSQQFVASLFKGKLKVKEVKEKFKSIYEKKQLASEIQLLGEFYKQRNGDNIVAQIETLFRIAEIKDSAEAVSRVSEILKTRVDLTPVERIIEAEETQDLILSDAISKDVLNAGRKFQHWKKEDIKAFDILPKCKKLSQWLKENIKSTQQLKNFVELAGISAGESDEEVDRVLLFQTAINGYAPLLLDNDWNSKKVSFEDLLTACDKVILSVKKDRKLPQKLIDANRFLEWIKAIKDRHGSVEESSMNNVTQINESGVCTINSKGIQMEFKQIGDENDSDNLQKRNFNHDELSELRSKLMLITINTDGKILVERFLNILSLVEVVSTNLDKLIQTGCHLFANWQAKIYCDSKRKVSVIVNFGYDANKCKLVQGGPNLDEELHELASYLKVTQFAMLDIKVN